MSSAGLRVGIVGAGHISAFHLAALERVPGVRVAAIADPDESRATAVASRHQIPIVCGDVGRMLTSTPLDVVHVLTPPANHADTALRALDAGCHAFVEKPLATSGDDCRAIARAAAAARRSVCVGHSLLW